MVKHVADGEAGRRSPGAADAGPSPDLVRGADLLVDRLIRRGVTTVFGVPGDTGVSLYDALYHHASKLRHVLARDERHAAAMADAYARVTNEVGVVEVSSGGGTTYVIGGLGEPYASSVPLLVITSDIQMISRGTGALTEINQVALFSAVTKWSTVVEHAADIPAAVDEALRQATTGRPAPVALILPENILDEQVTPRALAHDDIITHSVQVPRSRPAADGTAIAKAADLISQASQPVVVAGSGVHISQAWDELRKFAEDLRIPVATTIHGKGALADSSEWSLGIVGANGGSDAVNAYVAASDAVLFIGTRANATDTNGWTAPMRSSPVVQIDIEEARAGRNFPGGIGLVGDARAVLTQLHEAVTAAGGNQLAAQRLARDAIPLAPETASPIGQPDADGKLSPAAVIRVAQEAMGESCVVIADPGTPTPYLASCWQSASPGRRVIIPRGHGPMGYAIPAAIGAALACPDAPVLALTADGSFAMSCGELETVHRLSLPIVYVQLTNFSLGWIKMLQHLYFDQRYFSVDPGPIDAVKVAEAAGLRSCHVENLTGLRAAIGDAVAARTPLYIDVNVRPMIEERPPVPAWAAGPSSSGTRAVY